MSCDRNVCVLLTTVKIILCFFLFGMLLKKPDFKHTIHKNVETFIYIKIKTNLLFIAYIQVNMAIIASK